MSDRPMRSWPMWRLKLALMFPRFRGLWSDAWIEVWHREVYEPALAATDNESGPWAVRPPEGMH